MFARIPVGQAEDGFAVSEAPPTVAARELPKTVRDAGIEAVGGDFYAFFGGKLNGHIGVSCFYRWRRAVLADGSKGASVAVMAGDEVEQ